MDGFLVFDNVSKSFGSTRAVDGVTLGIGKGEVFSLLGPSGCGKTTLLRMAAGFEQPDTGRILLDGKDITHVPPNRRPVNTVFQNYALFPHLSVRDNIAFGPRAAGIAKRDCLKDVDKMLALVKLTEHADKKPAQLSGGQKQRVAIARALINQPQVLLLDEPLAALDLKLRQHMLAELHNLHREIGTTFIYVTHDQTEAIGISDRIAVMQSGRVEQCGEPREIYESPRTHFVASFIGDTNFLAGQVVGADAESCQIRCDGVGEIRACHNQPLPPNQAVQVSIRPEGWRLSATATEQCLIEGCVDDVMYLGAHSRLSITVGGKRLIVHRPTSESAAWQSQQRGSPIWLGVLPEDVVVLPSH